MQLDQWCEDLARTGSAVIRLRGTSMTPALRDGEVVCVSGESPRWGDVAVLRTPRGLVCHRQVWRSAQRIAVKGDGRTVFESFAVPREAQVLGRVTSRRRGARFKPLGHRWVGLLAAFAWIPIRLVRR